jgi:hypothetical protein
MLARLALVIHLIIFIRIYKIVTKRWVIFPCEHVKLEKNCAGIREK